MREYSDAPDDVPETAWTTSPWPDYEDPAILNPGDQPGRQLSAVNLFEDLSGMGVDNPEGAEIGGVPPRADRAEMAAGLELSHTAAVGIPASGGRDEAGDRDDRTGAREGGDAPVRSLAAMTDAELTKIARVLFERVYSEDWQTRGAAERPSVEEQYEDLRQQLRQQLEEERRVDAFRYTLHDGRKVLIVTPPHGDDETAAEHAMRVLLTEAAWKAIDVLIGVPVSVVLNPPTDLLSAIFYAPSFGGW